MLNSQFVRQLEPGLDDFLREIDGIARLANSLIQ
jgi:hypothetical protein